MRKFPLAVGMAFVLASSTLSAKDKTDENTKIEARYKRGQAAAKLVLDAASKKLEADIAKNDLFSQVVADDYKRLSEAYYQTGDLESSIEYILRALKIEMKIRKEDDPKLAKLYYDAGNMYYMNKQHPTAILYMEKAAEIYLKSPQKESLALADTYEAIASIYINLQDLDKSLLYAEKCLQIREKMLPENDEARQRSVENIAFLKQEIAKQKR